MVDLPEGEYEERVERSRLAREEGRQTLSEQTETLSDIDEKAIQIFRIDLLAASVLVTGFSIAVGNSQGGGYEQYLTLYTGTGALLLLASMIFASITYTSTANQIGISRNAINDSILNQDFDYDLVQEQIAKKYGDMIYENFKKNATNVLFFTLTLMSTVAALCYISIGLLEIYSENLIHPVVNILVLIFFGVFGKLSGLYGTIERWNRLTSPRKRFTNWCQKWREKFSRGDETSD
ncbi:hypothetical protein EXE43_02200 [Halorubrum sp. SS5]|nr:hypothetical protein EXE43_02200 [Halorubrum sp. SS5]